MSEFIELDAKAPVTSGAVVEAITRLSTLGEAKIMELVSKFESRPKAVLETLKQSPYDVRRRSPRRLY